MLGTDKQVEPRMIVAIQTAGPLMYEWLANLAEACGPIELWVGSTPPGRMAGVAVRPAPAYNRSSAVARVFSWLHFAAVVAAALLRRGGRTPFFVVTNPPIMPLVAWLLYKCQKRPFGLLEWDIYPHILVPMGVAGPRSPLFRIWFYCHSCALHSARLVVTIGGEMAKILQRMAEPSSVRVDVIPNAVYPDLIKPLPRRKNPFARKYGLNEQLVVLYSGNLGDTHDIETLLAVAEKLRANGSIIFLIIGEGPKQRLVAQSIHSGRTPNLLWLPLQPADQLPYTLSVADVAVATLAAGYEKYSMPSKTYSIMAVGAAVLGISEAPNDLAATIEKNACGMNFPPGSVEAIAGWLTAVAADRCTLDQLKDSSRKAAVESYGSAHFFMNMTRTLCETLMHPNPGKEASPRLP